MHWQPTKLRGLGNPNLATEIPIKPNSNIADSTYPVSIIIVHIVEHPAVKMSSINKIAATSPSRQNPSELEQNIAQALYDLETNTADLKVALRPLQFVSAREVRTT